MEELQSKLNDFHKGKVNVLLERFSDIAGDQFPGEFNVSGFHNQILELPDKPDSIWGVDRCMRIQETPDEVHSFVFHMGIYAKSLELNRDFIDPFNDSRFHRLQEEVLSQFLELLKSLNIELDEVEATYLDGATVGGVNEGRDKILKRKYDFPADSISRNFLESRIKLFPVQSLANVDIHPIEGALVGPRLEVAYKGLEIGTIVFDCYKVQGGNLVPINYVVGYAIGLERLISAMDSKDFLKDIERYREAYKSLKNLCPSAESSLFKKEAQALIYSAEVLSLIPQKVSDRQDERIRNLKKSVSADLKAVGLYEESLEKVISLF